MQHFSDFWAVVGDGVILRDFLKDNVDSVSDVFDDIL